MELVGWKYPVVIDYAGLDLTDKSRPVLVLTREIVRPHLNSVTIAPITSTIRGLSTELQVGTRNGLSRDCVVACDHITTIPADALGEQIGLLLEDHRAFR